MVRPARRGGPVTIVSQTSEKIESLRAEGRAAFVAYLPVGFPDVAGSVDAVRTVIEAGADVVELGIPYSDPVMDGTVIQHATQAALAGGVRLRDAFAVVEQVAGAGVPIVLMSYFNPILAYGVDAFSRDLAAAGGAGIITPDLIPDEASEWVTASDAHGLDRIFLVAPSSTRERLALTAKASRGFVYASSTMGVTGERATLSAEAEALVARTREAGAERVCVGVGVSTPEQATEVGRYADGVIVGTALVRQLVEAPDRAAGLKKLSTVARALAEGVRGARREETA
ncbi:MAG: tryptophan synthase subunit alpha [Actinomycetales bacterium]|nr:tryptophan synthase subunit alpha [Actinomycetales bacterium]